ncbi:MAG: class B sortase [Eggerthellaceae bacterium]|nr:class B sortase [Eggerthellaceae bacterium]
MEFGVLAEVNPDVVGRVRMEGSPIDYPVVAAHFDGSHYLGHNFSGEEPLHGQVALAFGCGRRMGGHNTVLAAHTMNDWSMFRAVRALCDQDYLDAHPAIDLMAADGGRLRGRWFAAARYGSDDPWPTRTRFDGDEDFAAWLERALSHNWLETGVHPSETTRVLTCCTCAHTPGPHDMRAVFAVLEEA